MVNHSIHNVRTIKERTSVFTSNGSLTLEAAVVVPFFFLAMLCLACVLEMMSTKMLIRNGLCSAGREISQQSYVLPIVSGYSVKQHIVKNVGETKLDNSLVSGGSKGLMCSASDFNEGNAVYDLSVRYRMEVPILLFRLPFVFCEEKLRVKGWTGLASGTGEGEAEDTVVYVTKSGTVYHKDMFCTYLVMSVKTVTWDALETLRNQSGGRYYACENCANSADNTGRIYVTDYGDRYHVSIGCSTLKRVVYALPYKEVSERKGCSKCVK